jgi:hypothetical protein
MIRELNLRFYKDARNFAGNVRKISVRGIGPAADGFMWRYSLTIHRSIVALTFFVALLGLGQTKPETKPVAPAKAVPAKKAATPASRPVETDAQIEKAIRQRFAKSKISTDKFEVHVQGGRVTITGATEVLQHKGTATRLARAAGATDVVNKVEPSEAAKNKASGNLAKGRRRAQIKRSDTVARSEQR